MPRLSAITSVRSALAALAQGQPLYCDRETGLRAWIPGHRVRTATFGQLLRWGLIERVQLWGAIETYGAIEVYAISEAGRIVAQEQSQNGATKKGEEALALEPSVLVREGNA